MNYVSVAKLGLRNNWAPQSCYSRYLHGWPTGTHQSMPSAVLVFWKGQNDNPTDFYFYLTKINGHNPKCKHTTVSHSIPSGLRPVEHDDSPPVLKLPQHWTLHEK